MNPILNTKLISRKEFEKTILDRFGLRFYKESVTTYKDLYSCNKHAYSVEGPLVFTCTFIDRFGFSVSDVNGEFFKEQYKQGTQLYKEFREFLSSHTFKIKNHYFV